MTVLCSCSNALIVGQFPIMRPDWCAEPGTFHSFEAFGKTLALLYMSPHDSYHAVYCNKLDSGATCPSTNV